MKALLENIELILTGAGLLVIFSVSLWLGMENPHYWPLLAGTAIFVGVLHGLIFWVVRSRQREERKKALVEAQQMLKDVINNQLAVIQIVHETTHTGDLAIKTANERVICSINLISDTLKNISEESLKRWRSKYENRMSEDS